MLTVLQGLLSPRKHGTSVAGSSAVLVVFVVWGEVPPATDLAIKISRRHRHFPVQHVLRQRLRDRREGSGKHWSHKELGVTVVGVEEQEEEGG